MIVIVKGVECDITRLWHVLQGRQIEAMLLKVANENKIKLTDLTQMLRVCLTGKAVGFSLYETISILGPTQCLNRIDRAIQLLKVA